MIHDDASFLDHFYDKPISNIIRLKWSTVSDNYLVLTAKFYNRTTWLFAVKTRYSVEPRYTGKDVKNRRLDTSIDIGLTTKWYYHLIKWW